MSKVATTLKAVTVYPDRARLARVGQVALEAGTQQLELADLPLQMNTDSARVTGRGLAQARLLGLQIKRVFYQETPAGQTKELEAQLEAAQDEQRALEAGIELVKQNRAYLDALAGHTDRYARALGRGQMSVEGQLALFDGLRAKAAALDGEQFRLLGEKRSLERRIQQLKGQLEQLRSARPRERYAAFVEVEALQPGSLELELSYVVSGAGWKPLYDLRLLEEAGQAALEIGYLAQVTQQTGEDWLDVSLSLSTARPSLAATLPELEPWYVRPYAPPQPRQMGKADQAELMMLAAPAAAFGPAEMEDVMAEVDDSGAAVTYHVPSRVNIPADGAAHKVTVARYALSPRMDYVSAPKLVEAAYRRAIVTNDSAYTLLPGSASLFANDEFLGSAQLELTAPQGEIEVTLGVDDRLKVGRQLKRREVDKTMIGGKRRIRYAYEIRLENLLPAQVSLTLHDQLPVARHEDIKVRLDAAEPKPSQQSELNLLDWELSLAPKEKRTLRFDFSVEYPQAMEVIGLP
jgi:uncharacterized protein (TIGR02231 family)